MKFTPGTPKPPNSGRRSGTPNRLTAIRREVAVKLAAAGFDPIERMVQIAKDPNCTYELQGKICAELCKYIHPQRKAIEITGPGGEAVQIEVSGFELLKARLERVAQRQAEHGSVGAAA